MFNILGDIEGGMVLDLFSGSGLMALEALSRGAAFAVSIEANRRVLHQLQDIRIQWNLAGCWQLLGGGVHAMLPKLSGRCFDLVFADPPYAKGISEKIPLWLSEAQISCRRLVIEESAGIAPLWPKGWTAHPPRRYGGTCLHFLEPEEQD